jgi:hypothetical protein
MTSTELVYLEAYSSHPRAKKWRLPRLSATDIRPDHNGTTFYLEHQSAAWSSILMQCRFVALA